MYLDYSLFGVTCLYLSISLWAVFFVVEVEWFRVVKPLRTVEILCILLYWNVILEWESLFFGLIPLFPRRILGLVG